jgi:hypothetical protein
MGFFAPRKKTRRGRTCAARRVELVYASATPILMAMATMTQPRPVTLAAFGGRFDGLFELR